MADFTFSEIIYFQLMFICVKSISADLYSQNVIVKEDEDAVIWCHFDDNTP